MESLEIKKGLYDFHEEHLARQEPSGSFADKCITVCGLDDKEFAGAFHGPKHEVIRPKAALFYVHWELSELVFVRPSIKRDLFSKWPWFEKQNETEHVYVP